MTMNASSQPESSLNWRATTPEESAVSSKTIGNYQIIRRIAVGGMAEIFLAWQHGPGGFRRQVVLKRIHPHLSGDPEFVAMFENEAQIAAGLSHPNIVHVYELIEDEQGNLYLAMEHIQGESVQGIQRRLQPNSQVPIKHAVEIAMQVCEALDAAHTSLNPDLTPNPLVHRDVSPSNIIVSVAGRVKLVDFGIAKALTSAGMTQAGHMKGKHAYMSPEQICGEPIDGRSDLFSLGVVLFEMTTGRRLFRGKSEIATIKAVLYDEIPSPSDFVAQFPIGLEIIITRCLARDLNARYRSARDLATDLAEFAASNGWTADADNLSALLMDTFPERFDKSAPSSQPSSSGARSSRLASKRTARVVEPSSSVSSRRYELAPATSRTASMDVTGTLRAAQSGDFLSTPVETMPAPQFDGAGVAPFFAGFFDRLIIAMYVVVVLLSLLFWVLVYPTITQVG